MLKCTIMSFRPPLKKKDHNAGGCYQRALRRVFGTACERPKDRSRSWGSGNELQVQPFGSYKLWKLFIAQRLLRKAD